MLVLAAATSLISAGCSKSGSTAETFPDKTIRVVIPADPGGSADIVARQMEPSFSTALGGGKLKIDNLPGGGMNVGAVAAAHAQPDCYTMIYHIYPNILLGNLTTKNVNYKPDDFAALGTATYEATVIRVRNDSPYKTIQDLAAAIRQSPGKLKTAVSPQSSFFISGLYLGKATGLDFKMVPYGGSESRLALEKGEVDFLISGVFNTQSIAGSSRVLGVLDTENKWPELTDNAPTVSAALGTTIPSMSSRIMALVPAQCKTDNPDRFTALENAFATSVKSPEYLAELTKTKTQASLFPQDADATNQFLTQQVPVIQGLVDEYPVLQPQ
jgi:tripartite-type tricarboxylate transporter receptor subunit TctC